MLIITGADSGIGRAVAVHFAREGAKAIVLCCLDEHKDAQETQRLVEAEGCKALCLPGDVGDDAYAKAVVDKALASFGGQIDVLVNNAAEQHCMTDFLQISKAQLERTFRTNIFGYFFMAQAVVLHMKEGAAIICTTSVTAYKGHPGLVDYSSTKGAIVAFVRSLSLQLHDRKIRVNVVAPGPIWTPLILATFSEEKMRDLGDEVPMERSGQPSEVAPSCMFLASADSSYDSGQVLHPNSGSVVNG